MRTRYIIPALLTLVLTVGAESNEYVVQAGDTLYGIARTHGVDAAELMRINGIELPELLLPGTVLRLSVSTTSYEVRPGDTLYSIARLHGTNIDDLRSENALERDTIVVGQVLRVPTAHNWEESRIKEAGATDPPDAPPPGLDPPANTMPLIVAEQIPFDGDGTWPVAGEKERLQGKLPGVVIRPTGNAAVQAIAGGRVVYSGPHTSFGNVVFVESATGFIYVYGGQESVEVGVGQTVEAGARIGTTREELYFTVWKDNRFVDPVVAPRG